MRQAREGAAELLAADGRAVRRGTNGSVVVVAIAVRVVVRRRASAVLLLGADRRGGYRDELGVQEALGNVDRSLAFRAGLEPQCIQRPGEGGFRDHGKRLVGVVRDPHGAAQGFDRERGRRPATESENDVATIRGLGLDRLGRHGRDAFLPGDAVGVLRQIIVGVHRQIIVSSSIIDIQRDD